MFYISTKKIQIALGKPTTRTHGMKLGKKNTLRLNIREHSIWELCLGQGKVSSRLGHFAG